MSNFYFWTDKLIASCVQLVMKHKQETHNNMFEDLICDEVVHNRLWKMILLRSNVQKHAG